MQGDADAGPWNSESVFNQTAISIGAGPQCGVEIDLSENVSEWLLKWEQSGQCRTCGCPHEHSMFHLLPWVLISSLWVLTHVAAQAGLCPQAQTPSQHRHWHGRGVPSAWSPLHSLSKCCHSEITSKLNSTSATGCRNALTCLSCLASREGGAERSAGRRC